MPTSEIDDIFAAKGKAKAVELAPLPSTKKEKKKKKKDRPSTSDETKEISRSSESKSLKKRPLPETVVDPSLKSSSTSKRPKLDTPVSSQREKIYHETRKEDEDRFKDSRGSGPSKLHLVLLSNSLTPRQDEKLTMVSTFTRKMSWVYPMLEEVCCTLAPTNIQHSPGPRHSAVSFRLRMLYVFAFFNYLRGLNTFQVFKRWLLYL